MPDRDITDRSKIALIKTAINNNDTESLESIFTDDIPDFEAFRVGLSREDARRLSNTLFKTVNQETWPVLRVLAQFGVPVKAVIFADERLAKSFVPEILENIFANGQADVNETLLIAVRNENAKMVQFLLQEHGANINHQDCFNHTPLMVAVECQNLEMVKLLCTFGADFSMKDDRSFQALDIAIITGNEAIVEYLIGLKAPATCPFHDAYISGSLKIVKMLASGGYNVNESLDSYYVLPVYIEQEEYEFAEVLIDSGADVNVSYLKRYGNEEKLYSNVLDLAVEKLNNCKNGLFILQRLLCKLLVKTKQVDCHGLGVTYDFTFTQD